MAHRPPLTVSLILTYPDSHRRRTGRWPHANSGPVVDAPGETWGAIQQALYKGCRGLPGGSSLARLLGERRGRPNGRGRPPLTVKQILGWADRHRRRTGRWPSLDSGPVLDAPGENWRNINAALWEGCRGLPGRWTLARLLDEHRGPARRSAAAVSTQPVAAPCG